MVSCLLEELVKVRQGSAENEDTIRNLQTKIQELEEDKKRLRETTTDNSVAHLQDELIASKLREAEASLSLKELKQRVLELSSQWQRHLHEQKNEAQQPPESTPKKLLSGLWDQASGKSAEQQKLEEELMTTRIREIETLTELKELRLKVMELETQVQVSTNQLRRQDEEYKKTREELDQALVREKDSSNKAREQQHR
jgi:ecotropic viral integration site 5 protein